MTRPRISKKVSAVTFTVSGVSKSGVEYVGAANHDSDGGSKGTSMVIEKP